MKDSRIERLAQTLVEIREAIDQTLATHITRGTIEAMAARGPIVIEFRDGRKVAIPGPQNRGLVIGSLDPARLMLFAASGQMVEIVVRDVVRVRPGG
jgi:hypothetical protein